MATLVFVALSEKGGKDRGGKRKNLTASRSSNCLFYKQHSCLSSHGCSLNTSFFYHLFFVLLLISRPSSSYAEFGSALVY